MVNQDYEIAIYDVHEDYQFIQQAWNQLYQQGSFSFFLSWGWIESWIRCLPKDVSVFFILLSDSGLPKNGFFIGTPSTKLPLASLKRVYLNSTGIAEFDKIFIEYNSILTNNDNQVSIGDILSSLPFSWDEFVLPGLDPLTFPGNKIESSGLPYQIKMRKVVAPFVDLEKVKDNNFDYLGLLSSNTRSQIRRSYRRYQKEGEIEFKVAETLEEALGIFTELMHLHQVSWRRRGITGCFSSSFFVEFHQRLINFFFPEGKIQIAKLCCGDKTIACGYNFVDDGTVFFYQSGLEPVEHYQNKPGLMIHAELIKYNSIVGNKIYDFLAGSSQYKKSLSTGQKKLIWARIQKNNFKNYGYNVCKDLLYHIKNNLFR